MWPGCWSECFRRVRGGPVVPAERPTYPTQPTQSSTDADHVHPSRTTVSPLSCGGWRDSRHAAAVQCYHPNMDQNLWGGSQHLGRVCFIIITHDSTIMIVWTNHKWHETETWVMTPLWRDDATKQGLGYKRCVIEVQEHSSMNITADRTSRDPRLAPECRDLDSDQDSVGIISSISGLARNSSLRPADMPQDKSGTIRHLLDSVVCKKNL